MFVSACWGGYAEVARAIQSGARKPYVVGPLVNIVMDDADAVQEALLDLLNEGPPTFRSVYRLIRRFNENTALREEEYGSLRSLFGVTDPAGRFMPKAAMGSQLAAPVEEDVFEVRRMLYRNDTDDKPLLCVVEDTSGGSWQANVATLRALQVETPNPRPGLRFWARYQCASVQTLLPNVTQTSESGFPMISIVSGKIL